jgi:tetratricopeptide (TPR) repeat protein
MRLSYLPLLIAASIACHSTEPSSDLRTSTTPEGTASEAIAPQATALQNAIRVEGSLTAPTLQDGSTDLSAQADLLQRRREQSSHLSDRLVEEGQNHFDRAQMEEALTSFSQALELSPSNAAARAGLRKTHAVLGDPLSQVREVFDGQVDQILVRRAQARLQVEEYATQGDLALSSAQYQSAVEQYRNAANVLSIHPLIATEELDAKLVEEKLNQAIRLRDENMEASAAMAQAEAALLQAEAEEQSQLQRERTLKNFYDHANEDFLANRYEDAEKWANLILAQDPENERARQLRTVAQDTRYARKDEDLRLKLRLEWLKTFDELSQEGVPQTTPIKFDIPRWQEVSKRTDLAVADLQKSEDPDRAAVMLALRNTRFEVRFGGPDGEGTELATVAKYLQNLTGVNFYITPGVTDELDEEETTIDLTLNENNVYNVLNIIADTRENLTWVVQDGIVKFVTRDQALGGQVLVNYPVHDLITPVRDYAGPVINVAPSGGIESNEEEPDERESNVISGDQLEQLIQNSIGGESWDSDPRNSIRVVAESGTLVVSQTPEVHYEIQSLLADLREATGIMVDVQAQFVKVEDNFLEDIGVDFRGLGPPGLGVNGQQFNDFGDPAQAAELASELGRTNDLGAFYDDGGDGDFRSRMENLYDRQLGSDEFRGSGGLSFQWTFLDDLQLELVLRAVSKSERIELVTAPRLLVANNARSHLAVLNQVSYVQDFDVEIAQASSIADPVVRVTHEGVILDVRPVVSADRRFVTMELRPTVARLKRPIAERVTTLGSQTSVTIQLPEIEYQRVRTTIPIPDGGTVMLGGMKEIERQDYSTGVPILNKIPILSALFERKGHYVSNRKLLILLRADIVIPAEHEPSEAEMGAHSAN